MIGAAITKLAGIAIAAIAATALLQACDRTPAESALSKRICGVTIKDPRAWLLDIDKANGRKSPSSGASVILDPDVGQTATSRELYEALANCVFNYGRDLAASGEAFEAIYAAEKAQCAPFQQKLEDWGYTKDKAKHPDWVGSNEQWLAGQEATLREDAQNSFIADKAGRCWEHPHYIEDSR